MNSSQSIWLACVLATVATGQAAEKRLDVYPTALLAFEERGAEVKDFGPKVADLVFARLIAEPEIYLVDRVGLQKVLEEQQLGLSGLSRPDDVNRVGQLTGARILVCGSVVQVDKSIYIIAKIVGTETGRVAGASVKGKVSEELAPLAEALAEKIAQTIREQAHNLVAKPVAKSDRIAELRKSLGKEPRPPLFITISERHVGQRTIDPAAETEFTLFCRETGFSIIDAKDGSKSQADVVIVGEGFSEFAARNGGLVSAKARVEIKAIDRKTDRIIAVDRQTTVAVDLSEQIAGKTALQEAAASIAERLLPKLSKP